MYRRNVAASSICIVLAALFDISCGFVIPLTQKGSHDNHWTPIAIFPDFYPVYCDKRSVQPQCVDDPGILDQNRTCDIVTCLSFTNRGMSDGTEVILKEPIMVFGWKCREIGPCTTERCDDKNKCFRLEEGKWCPRKYCIDKYCTERRRAVGVVDQDQVVNDVIIEYPCGCQCKEL